jgi:hypothetical protein
VGERLALPEGPSRWYGVEVILRAIKLDGAILQILASQNVVVIETAMHNNAPETFPKIRLVPGSILNELLPNLLLAIARSIMDDPIHELRWMADLNLHDKEDVIRFITSSKTCNGNFMTVWKKQHRNDVLALRGFLACGLLVHCLEKRHRIDYGIKRREGNMKRMAVPFRANDTPSERSMFAQPDIELLYTTLSYYYDGLSVEEFVEVMESNS